jgi:hypothetical protein
VDGAVYTTAPQEAIVRRIYDGTDRHLGDIATNQLNPFHKTPLGRDISNTVHETCGS